jgi:hypothetical protein
MHDYYREPNGDYMEVDPQISRHGMYDVRATAFEGNPRSVQGCLADESHLNRCTKVLKRDVPVQWARMFDGFSKEELDEAERTQVEQG